VRTNQWDICVVGVSQSDPEYMKKVYLNNLDKEFDIIGYDRYGENLSTNTDSYRIYLKIKRIKDFKEIVEEAVDETITEPLKEDILVQDIGPILNEIPASFRIKPLVFKRVGIGEDWSVDELCMIQNYVSAWKELSRVIFYFTQMGEGEELAHFIKINHPAIYGEIMSRKEQLRDTIIGEFIEFL